MLQNVEEYPELKHPRFDHGLFPRLLLALQLNLLRRSRLGPNGMQATVCVCVDFSGLYKQLTSAIPFYQQGLPDNVAEHVNAGALG